ncbi:MAG: apolipoprotein N-acyltransferase, partial [Bdellovibrionaceae bacterium]|nr:apolipoprotein N-acyltransferase [Pseudobdellovibrionaceae bacterium]
YEGLFPEFTRSLAQQGAHFLANVTNDSWFGYPFEPRQHMIMTFARGIEVRRPVIRATNTGITSAMNADGKILGLSPLHEPWTGLFSLSYRTDPYPTLWQLFGHLDWVLWLLILLVVIAKGALNARPKSP